LTVFFYDSPQAHAAAKVKDYLQPYVEKAEAGEDIDLKQLAIDVKDVLKLIYEEEGVYVYPPMQDFRDCRIVGIQFEVDDTNQVHMEFEVEPI
jgi:hypothetical protein